MLSPKHALDKTYLPINFIRDYNNAGMWKIIICTEFWPTEAAEAAPQLTPGIIGACRSQTTAETSGHESV